MIADWLVWLTEPFHYPFMQRAVIAALVTSTVCSLLSCYLVLKGWSLMGDAISHAVLPGIVLAFLLGIPLVIGAFLSGLFCAIFTGYLRQHSVLKEDTVMGIVFSGMFALGIVLFTAIDTEQHLNHILFGNILGITKSELIQSIVIAMFTTIILLLKQRDLLAYCFDPLHAGVIGLSVKLLYYGLLSLLSLTIVASIQVTGVILVVAMLISPGMTALILTKRFSTMLCISFIVSVCSSLLGIFISYHIDASTSSCIVLAQAFFFLSAYLISRGLLHIKASKMTSRKVTL